MKNQFNRFAVRFLCAVLLGLVLLCLHGCRGAAAVFVPQFASPWELSKLAFWPMLGSFLLTGPFSGGLGPALRRQLPCLVATPLALFLALWAVSALRAPGGVELTLWVAAAAVGLALADQGKDRGWGTWGILAVALALFYAVLTFLPPLWGPFLDPADVAAIAAIPY